MKNKKPGTKVIAHKTLPVSRPSHSRVIRAYKKLHVAPKVKYPPEPDPEDIPSGGIVINTNKKRGIVK